MAKGADEKQVDGIMRMMRQRGLPITRKTRSRLRMKGYSGRAAIALPLMMGMKGDPAVKKLVAATTGANAPKASKISGKGKGKGWHGDSAGHRRAAQARWASKKKK